MALWMKAERSLTFEKYSLSLYRLASYYINSNLI